MTTVEAAQKWAEAKEALTGKRAAFAAAKAELEAAIEIEREAWCALEGLADRVRQSSLNDFKCGPPTVALQRNGQPEYAFDDGFGRK